MTRAQAAAYIMGQAAQLNARVAGMMSENMQRMAQGRAMAYTEEDFAQAALDCDCGHNSAMVMFHSATDD